MQVNGSDGKRFLTPRAWTVESAKVKDLDGDGDSEIVLVVWNRLTYGSSRPFWVVSESGELAKHVYVMRYADGGLVPVWMSSALGEDAADAFVDDDGVLHIVDTRGEESVWTWQGWGFKQPEEATPEGVTSEEAATRDGTHAEQVTMRDGASVEGTATEAGLSQDGLGSRAGNGRNFTGNEVGEPAENDGTDVVEAADEAGGAAGAAGTGATAGGQLGRVTFAAVGDNLLHSSICAAAYDADTRQYDFSPVYAPVAERIASFDLAAVCQETIFVEDRGALGDYPDFGTPKEAGDALCEAGFDIVASATNHAYDRGVGGLEDTLAFWRSHPDVTVLGLNGRSDDRCEGRTVRANGVSIALFDATYGLNGHRLPAGQEWRIDTLDDIDLLARYVAAAEGAVDATACFLHIGDEYAASRVPDHSERRRCRRLLELG